MNADIAARVRILDDYDDALARFFVLFLSKKEARFVSFQTLRAESISRLPLFPFLSLIFQKSLSSLSLSLSLRALTFFFSLSLN
jgi:hypothetical protein